MDSVKEHIESEVSIRPRPRYPFLGRISSYLGVIRRNRLAFVGFAMLLGIVLAGFSYPLPYDPVHPDLSIVSQPPDSAHWFGTDIYGFDVFSRVIDAGSRDIPLAAAGTLLSLAMGIPLGLLVSIKGRAGELMMRGLDAFQSFPLLILAIAAVTLLGNRLEYVVIAVAIINVPRFMPKGF